MIGDLIEYGKWLANNDLDDFGKDTKDADYIFVVNYKDDEFILDNLLDDGWWDFSVGNYKLYFPKIYTPGAPMKDLSGNLTALGYASQEVGINLREDTVFINLDLVKCKKLGWEGLIYL